MGILNKLLGNASEVSIDKLQEKYGQLLIEKEEIMTYLNGKIGPIQVKNT